MKKIFAWIHRLFGGIKTIAEKYIRPSIQVVEALKKAVDSPLLPIITQLIPGNIDDVILYRLKKALPTVLLRLRIADECAKQSDPMEVVLCAIKNLKGYEPDAKAATYHSIAALLSVYLSDGKLSWSEAVHLTEYIYQGNNVSD